MEKFIKLTNEELLLVRGGADKKKYNSVGEIIRRTNLKYAQDVVREAAIYRPHAKGNFDYEGAVKNVTWCNQSSYDVMEATGVHMEAFYGEPDGYKGKKGQRGAGYWVNANTACKNVENYIDKYAKEWVNAKIKEVGLTNIEAEFDYIGPNSVKNYNEAYTKKYNELYAEGKADCPIQEITAEQAQDLANQGYTVVVMWENTETDKKGNRYSGHISTVRPDLDKDKPTTDPQISNVGSKNELTTVSDGFQKGFKDGTVKYYYDRNQTFRANEGFERYGLAYNDLTKKQSISIHDPTYDENNYINYGKRKAEENEYLGKLKEEKFEEYLKQHPELYNSESKNFNFDNPFFYYELTKYALGKTAFSVIIDTRADDLRKALRNDNTTLLSAIKKGDKNVDNVLLGRITAGDYIEQKKAEIAAQEKARAEAEAKRIAEVKRIAQAKAKAEAEVKRIAEEKAAREKAERERLEKERLKQEEENRKREDKIANPSPGPAPDTDPNDTDNDTNDNDRDDKKDKDPEPWINKPDTTKKENDKNTGGGNKTPPKSGNDENPPPPKNNPPPKKGGGDSGISKPKPPKSPGGGSGVIYTPSSTDTGNEYYLDTLYGAKPFSAQESSAFNSTIISNELSALQPVSSLNVAGLPVNDVAIRKEPFGV